MSDCSHNGDALATQYHHFYPGGASRHTGQAAMNFRTIEFEQIMLIR
jgi:hypothetical protein